MTRKRLDIVLVERGLAESRAQAQALVMAGLVRGHSKPGEQVDEAAELEVTSPPPYVSRAGHKLANALDAFGVDPAGLDCLDLGASTGGFSDVLLQRGAARALTELPFAPQLITCDVSFISVRTALPPALSLAASGWQALVLVKPQFEAGRTDVPKGVVRDADVHRRVLHEIAAAATGWRARIAGVVDSGLPGPKGNREFVLYLKADGGADRPADLDRWIDDAVG